MTDTGTKDRIIEAAYSLLASRGYDATTTKEVGRVAGVAQGLVGYYFPSKDELFAAVFQRESDRYCEALEALVARTDAGHRATLAEVLDLPRSRAVNQPDWIRLRYELFSLGLRNPAVAPVLEASLAKKRHHLVGLATRLFGVDEAKARSVAPLLLALFDGLALQKLADPRWDETEAYARLGDLLAGLL